MKEGLFQEDGQLIYYENDQPRHAGVVKVDGDIYYISSKGRAVKGEHIVHGEMSNGILKRGTYTFGDDYKLVKGSYIAPRKRKKHSVNSNMRIVVSVCAVTVILLLAMGISAFLNSRNAQNKPDEGTQTVIPQSQIANFPKFDEEVLLCSGAAKQLFDHQMDIADAVTFGDPYRSFVFQYVLDTPGILYLSEDSEMTNCQEYALPENETAIAIDNLKTGTTYYYKAVVNETEYPGTFQTARSNRFLSVPGLTNTRDIGGYETLDGKIVKQGLLIRGVELDGLANPEYFLSDEAIPQVQDTFGFAYEMDLRQSELYTGIYQSCLGENVGHKFYGAPQYGQIFDETYQASLREIFTDLADPDKYPMYMHCSWGKDRTGTVVFLLQGLLNVSEEDMIQEYKLSGYTMEDIRNKSMDVVIRGMDAYAGETLQEKIVTYLTTVIGISESQIQSIRDIYLG